MACVVKEPETKKKYFRYVCYLIELIVLAKITDKGHTNNIKVSVVVKYDLFFLI